MGTLLLKASLPIPFLLGGILASIAIKVANIPVTWKRSWREIALLVAGYGIGRNFTESTLDKISQQYYGVIEASVIAISLSCFIAWWTSRHTNANLIMCVRCIMTGGLPQMILMAEEDKRA